MSGVLFVGDFSRSLQFTCINAVAYAELHAYMKPGELLPDPPEVWKADWQQADAHQF